jgi:hypothetical protein
MNRRVLLNALGLSVCGATLSVMAHANSQDAEDMTSQDLARLVAEAAKAAAEDLSRTFGKNELLGFALCTDDDVRTLYHVACTRQWARERRDPGIGYLYTEWTQTAKADPFRSLSQEIDRRASIEHPTDTEWEVARDERFEALTLGLLECRGAGVFDAATFLCVGSTAPSKHMKQLAIRAVERLNSAELAQNARKTW